ncbi:microtubule-associated tumor suppressor 1 A like protein [Tanacetum coccineum]
MAINSRSGSCNPAVVKMIIIFMGVSLLGYVVGPPLYWHLLEALAKPSPAALSSCPVCNCDCDSRPALSIPQGLGNGSFTDCVKHDPEVSGDTEKNFAELLTEELKLRETEALDSQQRADMALLEAKKLTSQYQKEADKCNSGMETCEEAREKAEAALVSQKQETAMWENRARQKGWKDVKANVQSQGGVQAF